MLQKCFVRNVGQNFTLVLNNQTKKDIPLPSLATGHKEKTQYFWCMLRMWHGLPQDSVTIGLLLNCRQIKRLNNLQELFYLVQALDSETWLLYGIQVSSQCVSCSHISTSNWFLLRCFFLSFVKIIIQNLGLHQKFSGLQHLRETEQKQ